MPPSSLDPSTSFRTLVLKLCCFLGLTLAAATLAHGQFQAVTGSTSTPIPGAGHDYIQMLNETVDPASGSVSLRLGAPVPQGRKVTVPFFFGYDSNGVHFLIAEEDGGTGEAFTVWTTDTSSQNQYGGWSLESPKITFTQMSLPMCSGPTCQNTYHCYVTTGYVFQDPSGTRHQLPVGYAYPDDPNDATNACEYHAIYNNAYLSGSDGHYQAWFNVPPNLSWPDTPETVPDLYVADADGTVYIFHSNATYPFSIEDRNGNVSALSGGLYAGNSVPLTLTDTVGRTALSISNYTRPVPSDAFGGTIAISGLSNSYSLTWGTATTNWTPNSTPVASTPPCYPPPTDNETQSVVTAITLPNGKQYQFAYDSTYGLLNKITYPTGGYVQYAWGVNPLSAAEFYEGNPYGGNNYCAYIYDKPVVSHRYVSFDGNTVALQQDFTYPPTKWNTTAWTTKSTTVTTHDLVRGTSYQTIYTYPSGERRLPSADFFAPSC